MHILKRQNHRTCTINLPLSQQVKDLNAHGGNTLALDHTLCCIHFFSTEKKVHGKFHVWRAQNVDSSVTKHVSSVVQVHNERSKHVGRAIHFSALQFFGTNREFATIEIWCWTQSRQLLAFCQHLITQCNNCYTFWIPLCPFLVTALDGEPFVWRLLNI